MALVTSRHVFIHIQKTGGMAVRRALHALPGPIFESGPIELERHIGLPELRVAHPGLTEGRFVFGFVRNPTSWLCSRWAFAMESGFEIQRQHRPAAAGLWIADCWAPRLEQFVDNYLERHPGTLSRIALHMLGWWSDRPVDFVGRSEHMNVALGTIMKMTDTAFDLPVERVNETAHKAPPLDNARANKVNDAERLMVEEFYSSGPYLIRQSL